MKRINLNGQWQFKMLPSSGRTKAAHEDVQNWMPATVPGTVHTDLLAAGKIPDPFYRMNELDVQWIDNQRWVYRKVFDISEDFLNEDAIHLVAEGLDTFAEITLNGRSVAKTSNMFVAHRFAIKRLLKIGNNILEICFDSPMNRIKKLEEQYGALQVSHVPDGVYARVYARKAQYSFGWDWGPKLATSGIWRSIHLEAFCGCRIQSVFARTVRIAKHNADVRVDELEREGRESTVLTFELTGKGFAYRESFAVTGPRKSVTIKIPNPNLWWPNGYGDQPLYNVRVSAEAGGIELDTKTTTFGIRTVRLLQQKDSEGKSFIVEINGEKIFWWDL
jgi:beta-mannosidase